MKKLNYIVFFAFAAIIGYSFAQNFEIHVFLIFLFSTLLIGVVSILLFRKVKLKFIQQLFIGLFVTIIFLPLIGKKETTSFEKRILAPEPKFRLDYIWGYFFEAQNYFSDRFAYRNLSVLYNSKFKFRVFQISSIPGIVHLGHENWLFHVRPRLVKNTSTYFTNDELFRVKQNLQIITQWFNLRGIKYYFMVVPIKPRIYPEMMGSMMKYQFRNSKLDQLYKYLKDDKTIRFIDVRDELIEGKKIRPTYIKTDTHWNQFGAFLAYQKIMKFLKKDFPGLKIDDYSEYRIDSMETNGGDLQTMMGFDDEVYFTHYEFINKTAPQAIIIDSSKLNNPSHINSIRKMPKPINAIDLFVVRDSYTEFLKIFLTPSFDKTFYAWTPTVPVSRVIEQKSNIILHEMLEDFITHNLELPIEIKTDTTFLKTYFPSYKNLEN